MITVQSLRESLEFKIPTAAKSKRHTEVRKAILKCGASFIQSTIPSPEQTLSIRKLEEAMFWANAAISREPNPPQEKGLAMDERQRLFDRIASLKGKGKLPLGEQDKLRGFLGLPELKGVVNEPSVDASKKPSDNHSKSGGSR